MTGVTSIGCLLLGLASVGFAEDTAPSRADVLASVRLHNPTAWNRPVAVEIPVGRLGTPGVIDWGHVRLLAEDGRELPFSIREGRAHWRAELKPPLPCPRAEDLLVFTSAVPPKQWVRVDLVRGVPSGGSAIAEDQGRLIVSYPEVRATIDRGTGMLTEIEAFGQRLLEAPLSISFFRIEEGKTAKQRIGPPRVQAALQSSTPSMTELSFVLEPSDRLRMMVTYRIHAGGLVEIWCDERPWQGRSPWVDHAAEIALKLSGQTEPLPFLANRAPFYGFKDYAAVVKHAAQVYRLPKATVLELGEETTNGRRWNRRLYLAPALERERAADLIELADEGLIVQVAPHELALQEKSVRIEDLAGAEVAARRIADALKARGLTANNGGGTGSADEATVVLREVKPDERSRIEGDGFEIRPLSGRRGVAVSARTRFGLVQAAWRLAEHLAKKGDRASLPLVAANPVVAIRSAGFGGGYHEVDFPYGSESEWQEALELLTASGMNVMADLGMWSDWKMPVSYRRMPELRSDSADAYDEVSGAKLAELDMHRERGLRLLRILHDRGVRVWLWLPTGCVPTTYAKQHPEAMAPGSDRCPCTTHPLYSRYLDAYLREVLETYPIDGIVMIRDDNGGLCPCERCKEQVAKSATRSAAWEQYLLLYRWLKTAGFRGDIAVYPYFDLYEPRIDPLLPEDLLIVGHGSGAAMLTRNYQTLAPMGDTWLDNVFAGFRVPSSARMKRLLADRSSFWLGGALGGSELPWLSLGRFGWEPTATVNTLRCEWAEAQFGPDRATAVVDLLDAYEQLWEIYNLPMLPHEWVKLDAQRRDEVATLGRKQLSQLRQQLDALKSSISARQDLWLRHVALFATYFEYHLRRLEVLCDMQALVAANKPALTRPGGLSAADRERLVAMQREVYDMAERFEREMDTVPSELLRRTRAMQLTKPFKEGVNGYDPSLEWLLDVKQFAGEISVSPLEVRAGEPFVLRVALTNSGLSAWMAGTGQQLQIQGDAKRLGLPTHWDFQDPWMVFGDRREIELRGTAPKLPGETKLELVFFGQFRTPVPCIRKEVSVRWR